jgi:hypothetical protein
MGWSYTSGGLRGTGCHARAGRAFGTRKLSLLRDHLQLSRALSKKLLRQ